MPIHQFIAVIIQRAEEAFHYANLSLDAARICDFERALRMQNIAEKRLNRAKSRRDKITDIVDPIPPNHMMYIARIDKLIVDTRSTLAAIDHALDLCMQQNSLFTYVPGANWMPQVLVPGEPVPSPNSIEFIFKLSIRCENPQFIQVYHIEKKDTGEILENPSEGDARYDPPGIIEDYAPRDSDAFDGYVVDADPAQSDPTMDTITADGVTRAFDKPDFVKKGYTAYFETCLVCLDNGYQILGCIRWLSEGPNGDVTVDQNNHKPSLNFERALQHWLNNRS